MDCDPPGFYVPGISHGRQLEWVAISFSRGYSWPRYQTHISCSGRQILYNWATSISSVQLSVVSNSLWPHGLQHARPPCPSPTPGVYSNSCPLSWWCHSTISSSGIPFSSWLQSFPASGSFLMSQFFASGVPTIGVSALASGSSSEYSGLISFRLNWLYLLIVQGTLKSLFQPHSPKASIPWWSAFFIVQLYICTWPLEKL